MQKNISMLIICAAACIPVLAQASHAPYAGQQTRQIKALSSEEIQEYLQGQGMGLAKAAELNHYPGPKHVLELASKLRLSQEQVAATRRIYDKMHGEAAHLGGQIVDEEKQLDRLFSSGRICRNDMEAAVSKIARLQGELRAVHLGAHLEMKQQLSSDQRRKYEQLRGYQSGGHLHQSHKHVEREDHER
ncbi:MAG TPA: periplasmic heavy metal sensor [Acidobacteriota bacterium]|jgi:hypothetical protein|nr:periplasmic heavy metal sensor [Acidobacteriota bacterium]